VYVCTCIYLIDVFSSFLRIKPITTCTATDLSAIYFGPEREIKFRRRYLISTNPRISMYIKTRVCISPIFRCHAAHPASCSSLRPFLALPRRTVFPATTSRNGIATPGIGAVAVKRPTDQRDDGTARANWVADNFINKQSLRQRKMRKAGDDRAEARVPKNKRVQRGKHTVRALAPGKRRLHCRNRMRSSGRTAGTELKYFARE